MSFTGANLNRLCILLVLCLATQFSGCDLSKPDSQEALKFFGISYFNYFQVFKKPASSWDDILKLVDGPGLEADVKLIEQARATGYVVNWGVDPTAANAAEVVLAYGANAKTDGGKVVFADGSLRQMSGDELSELLNSTESTN